METFWNSRGRDRVIAVPWSVPAFLLRMPAGTPPLRRTCAPDRMPPFFACTVGLFPPAPSRLIPSIPASRCGLKLAILSRSHISTARTQCRYRRPPRRLPLSHRNNPGEEWRAGAARSGRGRARWPELPPDTLVHHSIAIHTSLFSTHVLNRGGCGGCTRWGGGHALDSGVDLLLNGLLGLPCYAATAGRSRPTSSAPEAMRAR